MTKNSSMAEDMQDRAVTTLPLPPTPEAPDDAVAGPGEVAHPEATVQRSVPVTVAPIQTKDELIEDDRAEHEPSPVSPSPVSAKASGRRRPRLLATAAVLVIVALAAGLVVSLSQLRRANAVVSARGSALSAAKVYALDLGSYDYRHLDEEFAGVQSHSTPTFGRSFVKSSNALKPILVKYKATAQATVVAAGVTSASTDRAVVLVFFDQTVSNSAQKHGKTTDQSRLSMTLARTHGHWLIEQVQLL